MLLSGEQLSKMETCQTIKHNRKLMIEAQKIENENI